jgi:hypothetical protein
MNFQLISEFIEFIKMHWSLLAGFVFFLSLIFVIIQLVRVSLIEKKIEAVRELKKREVRNEKTMGVAAFGDGRNLCQIEDEFELKIKKLERKRKYILDKLPLIKK